MTPSGGQLQKTNEYQEYDGVKRRDGDGRADYSAMWASFHTSAATRLSSVRG